MENLTNILPITILGKQDIKNKEFILPLSYHLCDVALVGEYLWDKWLAENNKSIIESYIPEARSIFLLACYIHDLGKASIPFKSQLEGIGNDGKNHVSSTTSLLYYYSKNSKVLKSFLRELVSYHHGILQDSKLDDITYKKKDLLYYDSLCKSIDLLLEKLGLTQEVFIKKRDFIPFFVRDILSGLLIMADWFGSNSNIFGYYTKDTIEPYEKRKEEILPKIQKILGHSTPKNFTSVHDFFTSVFGFTPNALQKAVSSVDVSSKKLVFVEAPTGHGKTEAALYLSYRYKCLPECKKMGIYVAMPTCATSNALYSRFNNCIQSTYDNSDTSVLYHSKSELFFYIHGRSKFVNIDTENSLFDSTEEISNFRNSVCKYKLINSREFIIGTTDHPLKMCMNVKHFTMHHACLVNHIIVFDEVHSYDARMFSCLCASLAFLSKYNVPVIILSATMPEDKRQKLMEAYGKDKSLSLNAYPKSENIIDDPTVIRVGEKENHKYVHFDLSTQPEFHPSDEYEKDANAVINKIKQLGCNGYYGVVVNTVKRSQEFSEIFIKEFGEENVITLNSLMTAEHRSKVEKQVLSIVGKDKDTKCVPKDRKSGKYFKVIIATQIVEQSIDIDFDCLFTDLCPMDALVQRVGRLHRHSQNNPYRPEALREEWCFVLQAYSNPDVIHNDMASYCEEFITDKNSLKSLVDKYSKLVYDSYLLYSTYSELLSLKDGVMDTITQTEEKVKSVYGDGSNKTLYGVSLKDFYLKHKEVENKVAWQSFMDMIPNGSGNIFEFDKYFDKVYLLCNGVNDTENAPVRDALMTMEVVLLYKCIDAEGVYYKSCSDDKIVNVYNRSELEQQTIKLPLKIITKFNTNKQTTDGFSNLKDYLKCNKPDSVYFNHTEFLILKENETTMLEGNSGLVTLWYDKKKGLLIG